MTLPDPQALARKRLYGKRATNLDIAREIKALTESGLTQKEIGARLGYKDSKSIRSFIALADKAGLQSGRQKKSQVSQEWKFYHSTDDFHKDTLVIKWVENMKNRSRGGKAMKMWPTLLRNFQALCNTTKTVPAQWITGSSHDEVLEVGRTLLKAFLNEYMAGTAAVRYSKDPSKVDQAHIAYMYSKAARDFMRIHGFAYPVGEGGVMSQSINAFHGNYADVRISMEQYHKGKLYLIDKYGLDSDTFRWYGVGIEAFPRAGAIMAMASNYEYFITKQGKRVMVLKAYESKTSHYKKGIWTKYVFDSDVQKSVEAVHARGGGYIIEHTRDRTLAAKTIYPRLKEVYRHLQVDKLHLRDQTDPDSGYFMEHPSHVLRHVGAQLMLRKTNWNVEFVAKRGWKKSQELVDSYGEMPPEIEMEVLDSL